MASLGYFMDELMVLNVLMTFQVKSLRLKLLVSNLKNSLLIHLNFIGYLSTGMVD